MMMAVKTSSRVNALALAVCALAVAGASTAHARETTDKYEEDYRYSKYGTKLDARYDNPTGYWGQTTRDPHGYYTTVHEFKIWKPWTWGYRKYSKTARYGIHDIKDCETHCEVQCEGSVCSEAKYDECFDKCSASGKYDNKKGYFTKYSPYTHTYPCYQKKSFWKFWTWYSKTCDYPEYKAYEPKETCDPHTQPYVDGVKYFTKDLHVDFDDGSKGAYKVGEVTAKSYLKLYDYDPYYHDNFGIILETEHLYSDSLGDMNFKLKGKCCFNPIDKFPSKTSGKSKFEEHRFATCHLNSYNPKSDTTIYGHFKDLTVHLKFSHLDHECLGWDVQLDGECSSYGHHGHKHGSKCAEYITKLSGLYAYPTQKHSQTKHYGSWSHYHSPEHCPVKDLAPAPETDDWEEDDLEEEEDIVE